MAAFATSHAGTKKYDVFISFRGSDVRDGFLSHLTKQLRHEGIDVYVDERLERGDEISSALIKAIEGSRMALVIFSKDYASSRWCLQELVKIMECKRINSQIVIPVFYNVDPSHVRHQEGSYANAFSSHKQKFEDDLLQIWRSSLKETANLSGFHSSNVQNESDLIDGIIKTILKRLEDKDTIEPNHLMIGFQKNLSAIESFMKVKSQDVGILGIWGKGGIGKTTLARAIFDKFSRQFESSYFVSNVREESIQIGLPSLLDKIFSVLLSDANLTMKGRPNSQRRLRQIRVLLVLDDVNTSRQLQYLIEENLSFGPCSKVIITSRDRHVLVSGGVHCVHEVKELNLEESLQLFCRHAFKQANPKKGFEKLSIQAIQYAGGLPLALQVLGSYLNSRETKFWESALKKFRKQQNLEVQTVLRVSYDGLDMSEKRTFLNVAFFFKGEKKEDIVRILDACDASYSDCGIDDLVDKALIAISKDNTIEIHDLLQEMAEDIVLEESIEHPERRSRLNDAEVIQDILINNKGTDAIEGIILKIENLSFAANSFQKMSNLRFLKIQPNRMEIKPQFQVSDHIVYYPKGLDSLPNNLRYFYWERYPFKSLPLGYCPEKLVEIHLKESRIKKLWNGVQDLINLKIINLSLSEELKKLPDFSKARNLEVIDLTRCYNLRCIHPSILSLPKLVSLDLSHCFSLKKLHGDNHMESLKHLKLYGCYRLKELWLSSQEMRSLDLGVIDGIETLNLPIGRFNKLEELNLGWHLNQFQISELCCLTSVRKFSLSGFIDKSKLVILCDAWHALEELYLTDCEISEIPDNISALSSLKILSLRGSNVESLPNSIKHLSKLKQIDLGECKKLRSIPELPPSVTHFYADKCASLEVINFTMMRAILHNNTNEAKFCYPGGTISKDFKYSETKERCIAIELPSSSFDHLLGFVCYCTFSPSESNFSKSIRRVFRFDDEEIIYKDELPFPGLELLNTDHVFVWYDPVEATLEGTLRSRYYEANTYKFECEFLVDNLIPENLIRFLTDHHPIRTCGLCPIYASKLQEMDQQIEIITCNAEMVQYQPSSDSDEEGISGFWNMSWMPRFMRNK